MEYTNRLFPSASKTLIEQQSTSIPTLLKIEIFLGTCYLPLLCFVQSLGHEFMAFIILIEDHMYILLACFALQFFFFV